MKALTIILGVLLTICGVICLTSPAETFIETGYVVAIMLLIYGIIGIIAVIAKRAWPSFLWAAIPALIIGVFALFVPSDKVSIHIVLVYLLAAWFVLQGASSIYVAVRYRFFNRAWVLELIMGILSIAIGVYTVFHPTLGALTIGILVGIYMIEAGIDLIVVGATASRVEAAAQTAQAIVDEARDTINAAYSEVTDAEEQPAQGETPDTEETADHES